MDYKAQRKPRKIATKAILTILRLLNPDDRFAVICCVFRQFPKGPHAMPSKMADCLVATTEMEEDHFRAVYYGEGIKDE
jgi:hypothetical protein